MPEPSPEHPGEALRAAAEAACGDPLAGAFPSPPAQSDCGGGSCGEGVGCGSDSGSDLPDDEEHLKDLELQAKQALKEHAVHCAGEALQRHGSLTRANLDEYLLDSRVVRFPTYLSFDAAALQPGEFAFPERVETEDDLRFVMHVHPHFEHRDADLPLLVAYQLVVINYGDVVGPDVAEAFGATLCELPEREYYERVCALADELQQA